MAIAATALAAPGPASAHVIHTVEPGEGLWSIAFAHNYTTAAVAAANGLAPDSHLRVGETIRIPSEQAPAMGAYTVRLGDTLTSIAARSGVSVAEVARMNGLDADALLLAGSALVLPSVALPHPTQERVTPAFVQQVALEHGVSPSLAAAIAEQESGFNNATISAGNARGVMQILPGTWRHIENSLARYPLDPASASANVHAGVIYLGHLLWDTGGDEVAAAAAYYQGLSSVRAHGLLPETRAYVDNVMALRRKYGG